MRVIEFYGHFELLVELLFLGCVLLALVLWIKSKFTGQQAFCLGLAAYIALSMLLPLLFFEPTYIEHEGLRKQAFWFAYRGTEQKYHYNLGKHKIVFIHPNKTLETFYTAGMLLEYILMLSIIAGIVYASYMSNKVRRDVST